MAATSLMIPNELKMRLDRLAVNAKTEFARVHD
jgi:predicted transcriptional regulator